MRVYVKPHGLYSRAMVRVADALAKYAPVHIQIVDNERDCDISVLYVIGFDYIDRANRLLSQGKQYIPLQCCVRSTEYTSGDEWRRFWEKAYMVWSYLDLREWVDGNKFYFSPLGVDEVFTRSSICFCRNRLVITTGYVSDERAEAIEEVWIAADRVGIKVAHVGPSTVEGVDRRWVKSIPRFYYNISDGDLVALYSRASWVSGLRHMEGFELPALEGLCSGARPLLFDYNRGWYGGHGVYLNDCSGEELIEQLVKVFSGDGYKPVSEDERRDVVNRFSWERICKGFWEMVMHVSRKEIAA